MDEIWKDIKGYERLYQASSLGRIKSLSFYSNCRKERCYREKILKQKLGKDDSYRIELWNNKQHKTYLVHRLVATTFLEDLINTDMTVNHIDGNRLNNNIENLEWLTREDNIKYGFDNGQYPQAKLNQKYLVCDKN